MGEFANRVFGVVRHIPRGKVATYGQVARLIGAPRSARYVGYALRANPEPGMDPGSIPCHRVVFKDGRLAPNFAFGSEEAQRAMLRDEGIEFDDDGRVLMDAFQWNGLPEEFADCDCPDDIPFDWEQELSRHPLKHNPATCGKNCPDCQYKR